MWCQSLDHKKIKITFIAWCKTINRFPKHCHGAQGILLLDHPLLAEIIIRKELINYIHILLLTQHWHKFNLFPPCISPVAPFDGILVSFKHFEHSFETNQHQKKIIISRICTLNKEHLQLNLAISNSIISDTLLSRTQTHYPYFSVI